MRAGRLLHVAGVAIVAAYGSRFPVLAGLAAAAYLFGLRHAFDSDHIAAIDHTVRYMAQRGRNPLAVGLWFSLGHSTVVRDPV
ncbi:MAG: hypothetical protein H0X13_20005 [Ramlibacter sp.]|nr:hypothetical protein [Ramlibacter sp.]